MKCTEDNTPRPWLRPIDALLTNVENGMRSLVDVKDWMQSMVFLPDHKRVVCGCEGNR